MSAIVEPGSRDPEVHEELDTPTSEASSDARFDALLREVARGPETVRAVALPPGTRLGPYEIEGELGRGGMGVVHRARDVRLDRSVALKVIAGDHARSLAEARAAAAIHHPNLAAVFDVGEHEGLAFLALELIEGETLRARLARRPALSRRARRDIGRGLAAGLAAAHAHGIVHRDLKPENVVIARDGTPKILDFGLAARASSELEAAIVRAGTRGYLAPELGAHRHADPRADVFALGVVLHELEASRRPEPSEELGRLRVSVRSPVIRRVIARCLEPRPERRFRDGAEVASALDRAARIEAIAVWAIAALSLAYVATWLATSLASSSPAAPAGPSAPSVADARPLRLSARRLTATPDGVLVHGPVLAPDGARIAVVESRGTYLIDAETGARTPVPGPEMACVIGFTRDGQRIVGVALTPSRLVWIDVVARPGTIVAERALEGTQAVCPALSHDGRTLARRVEGGARIEPLEGDAAPRFVPVPDRAVVVYLAFGRDGTLALATDALSPLRSEIWIVRPGSDVAQLALSDPRLALEPGTHGLALDAAGRLVYTLQGFAPERHLGGVWRTTLDRAGRAIGPAEQLFESADSIAELALHDDFLIATHTGVQTDVVVAALLEGGRALGESQRLALSDAHDRPSDFAPDGALLLVSDALRGHAAYTLAPGSEEPVPLFAGSAWSTWPIASRDGAIFAWRVDPPADGLDALAALWRVGEREPLWTTATPVRVRGVGRPPPPLRAQCPLSAEPCMVAYVEEDLLLLDLDPRTNAVTPRARIAIDGGRASMVALSRDGTRVAFVDDDGRAIRIVDRDGETQGRAPLPDSCRGQFVAWLDDAMIVSGWCDEVDETYALMHLTLDGAVTFIRRSRSEWLHGPVVSDDGRTLAYAAQTFDSEVVRLEADASVSSQPR